MTAPHAVIIAGGRGSRLGGLRKADLRIGGVRLIDRVLDKLSGVAQPILVATGSEEQQLHLSAACIGIADRPGPSAGPLAGVIAAAHHLSSGGVTGGVLVSVAVDTPFLPPDFVSSMVAALGAAPAVYAAWGDDFFPTHAAWELEALQGLLENQGSDTAPTSLKALQRQMGARRLDWAPMCTINPFANINTMAELLEAQARAAS